MDDARIVFTRRNYPINRAEEVINSAFEDTKHSVNLIVYKNEGVSAPIEEVGPSFTQSNKECGVPTEDDYHYQDIGDWWYDHISCYRESHDDAVVLITAGSWGGLVGINYSSHAAVIEGGHRLTTLDSGDTYHGSTDGHATANTILHEIGHSVLGAFVNEHEVYDTYLGPDGDYGRTAMETSAVDISENACGSTLEDANHEVVTYSGCAEDKMQ